MSHSDSKVTFGSSCRVAVSVALPILCFAPETSRLLVLFLPVGRCVFLSVYAHLRGCLLVLPSETEKEDADDDQSVSLPKAGG